MIIFNVIKEHLSSSNEYHISYAIHLQNYQTILLKIIRLTGRDRSRMVVTHHRSAELPPLHAGSVDVGSNHVFDYDLCSFSSKPKSWVSPKW